ncbi:DNA primase [Candidatus Providencia siddallii]|uniref:DNA primase n=1 Tax=Candidatus Providencia siddallii TaxID=1715285 RepID=A0A0M6WAH2_9GAMM|nr:DNA primase [Candidatus Providencia siddallii]
MPNSFINELLSKTDIIELINTKIPLKKYGKNHRAFCPFHIEKTPSFYINDEKQFYHCFGCGAHGNAIDFLINYDKLNFVEAIEELSKLHGFNQIYKKVNLTKNILQQRVYQYNLMKEINHFYIDMLNNKSTNKAQMYLNNRGLNTEIINRFSIGFAPSDWNSLFKYLTIKNKNNKQISETGMFIINNNGQTYDRFRERIMFPIKDRNGNIIAFGGRSLNDTLPKYINSPETEIFHKSRQLFGLYEAIKNNNKPTKLLVVEGYIDVITLAQYNINYAVSSLGTSTTSNHIQLLFRFTDTVIYCYDGDYAGKKAAWRTLEISISFLTNTRQINFIFLPDGEDPDSLIRKEGKLLFEKRIVNAKTLSEFLFNSILLKVDLKTQEGKIKFYNLTIPLIKQIPNEILQLYMVKKLGQFIGIPDIDQIIAMINKDTNKKINYRIPQIKPTTMRILISLIIQYPSFSKFVPSLKEIIYIKTPGIYLFKEIVDYCHSSPKITTGQLLERYRNNKFSKLLEKLVIWNDINEKEIAKKTFLDALNHLFNKAIDERFNYLIAKERIQKLTTEERKEVYLLTISQTKLNKKNNV